MSITFLSVPYDPNLSGESADPSLRREQRVCTFVVTQEARTPSEATGTEQSRGEEERGGRLLEPGGGASSPAGAGQTDRPA
ncbi:hypothetical protein KUCAC02_033890 [Chaenocephalus aceratus]|nr:hypothetical protein KUCAC02_033890 [Chaenocephalus aceratus]